MNQSINKQLQTLHRTLADRNQLQMKKVQDLIEFAIETIKSLRKSLSAADQEHVEEVIKVLNNEMEQIAKAGTEFDAAVDKGQTDITRAIDTTNAAEPVGFNANAAEPVGFNANAAETGATSGGSRRKRKRKCKKTYKQTRRYNRF
jgi:hypothetical protein